MHPEPPAPDHASPAHDDDHPHLVSANAKAGLALFVVYLLLYGGFVALNAFAPGLMARPAAGGLNLAVLYGMGLIAAAFALALVYMALCRRIAERHASGGRGR
jgi:uncharacterized membrane protein (DUF485 family)